MPCPKVSKNSTSHKNNHNRYIISYWLDALGTGTVLIEAP